MVNENLETSCNPMHVCLPCCKCAAGTCIYPRYQPKMYSAIVTGGERPGYNASHIPQDDVVRMSHIMSIILHG